MRHDPLFLLWSINCPSPEDCLRLQQWLAEKITSEAVFVDEVRAFPGGTEIRRQEPHRLGDYFESVRVLPSADRTPMSFRLLFHRRATAQRFWKDLMVRILQMVREEAAQTTTTLEYQGEDPDVLVAGK
jgi:hypothetical protein